MEEAAAMLPVERHGSSTDSRPLTADTLCDVYAARVFKFAQLVSEDSSAAEDLAQDALERAIRGLKTFDPTKGGIDGWLWRIVVNAGRDAGRIERRQHLVFQLLVDRWTADERIYDVGELSTDRVLQAVRDLSRRHRAVIALRFGADLSYRSVGQALGISEAAALMSTRRALNILRLHLSQEVQQP